MNIEQDDISVFLQVYIYEPAQLVIIHGRSILLHPPSPRNLENYNL